MAGMARLIWFRRNSVIQVGDFFHPFVIYRKAVMAQEDFVKCHGKTTESDLHGEHEIHVSPAIWQPLQSNVVKINWDAAVNKKKGCIGIGVIARDC
jgi:hypothetical protein